MTKSKKINKVPTVAVGTLIEIAERTCSENLQRGVRVGDRFTVKNVTSLKNGTPAVEVANPKAKGAIIRINAERFRWKVVDINKIIVEHEKKRIIEDGRAKRDIMRQKFTDNEIDHILFTPYVYELLAWIYVDKCHVYAAENKLNYNKISRAAVLSKEAAAKQCAFELGEKVYKQFDYAVNVMAAEYERPLTRIWWQANMEIKRVYPDAKHVELKTYALVGLLALRLLDERERKSDEMIAERLKGIVQYWNNRKRSPILHSILEGYAEEAKDVDFKRLDLSLSVLRNNIECIHFETLHKEFRNNN